MATLAHRHGFLPPEPPHRSPDRIPRARAERTGTRQTA